MNSRRLLLASTSVRCAAAIFPVPEVDRTRRGHRENGAHGQELTFIGSSPKRIGRRKCEFTTRSNALSIPRSKDGIAQVRRSQRAFEPTHAWAVISASASLSSVPRRIRMWSGSIATRANTGDPQREQKYRRAPCEDSYPDILSSPAMTRYRSSGIRALAEKAVPLARRQRSQWQSRTSPMGAKISN
jgi:hypothetical protein